MSAKWLATIQPLVTRLELSAEAVTKAILAEKLVGASDDNGAESLADADAIGDRDFADAFPDAPIGNLKKAVKEMREAAKPLVEVPATSSAVAPAIPIGGPVIAQPMFVIPDVPGGESLLEALSTSKSLNVDEVAIRSALEALRADGLGLSEIPEGLILLMEKHADTIEEPVGDRFLEVMRFVRERKWAEVNVDSRLVTKERKQTFLTKLRTLPAAAAQFHANLFGWNEQLKSNRSANPFGVLGGTNLYPPPDEVLGASEIVVRCLTKAFGGLGVMIARAIAYESLKIRDIVEQPDLPNLTGQPTKELMLQTLGIGLTDADVRMEKNIAKYIVFVATQVPRNLPGGQEGPVLEALFNLGQLIGPWMYGTANSVAVQPDDHRHGRRDPYPVGGR
ncbi:MAG: hypothetical protein WC895_04820 [Candidatus Shapirobacteria bacterium]|jgi:hypothetical protein